MHVAPKWSLVRRRERSNGLLLLSLLGQEDSLDVGQDTTLGNGDTREELVQLFVVADGKLQVTGDDPGLLVVTGSIASQLENFSSQVLHDGSQVDGSASTYTFGIVSLAQETVDTANRELKTSPAAAGLGLALHLASLSATRHSGGCVLRVCTKAMALRAEIMAFIQSGWLRVTPQQPMTIRAAQNAALAVAAILI